MKRLLLLAAAALSAGGCGTHDRLLDPVHTPLVEVSPELSEAPPAAEMTPAERERHDFGPWP